VDKFVDFFESNDFIISSNSEVPGCDGRAVIIARKKKIDFELVNIVEFDELKIGGAQVGLSIPWIEQEYYCYVKWLSDRYGFKADEENTTLGIDIQEAYRVSLYHNYGNENQGVIFDSDERAIQWLIEKNKSFYDDEKQILKYFYCPDAWKTLPPYNIRNDRFLFQSFIVINKLGIEFSDELLSQIVERTEAVENIDDFFLSNLRLFNQYLLETSSPIESKFVEFLKRMKSQ